MPKIHEDIKLDYSDVLIVPKAAQYNNPNPPISRSDVDLVVDGVVPLIAANMDGVGTFNMALELANVKVMTALVKHYTLTKLINFYSSHPWMAKFAIYSMGMTPADLVKFEQFEKELERIQTSISTKPHIVCIDVANGYNTSLYEFVEKFKALHPNYKLMVGNVATAEGVCLLADAGADIIKIGIGPGSVCTTRTQTGVGYPQLSAVLECAEQARNRVKICADGGCTTPGDVAKAFGAGANYVMLGGMLAGCDEGGMITPNGDVQFYGMASKTAQSKHNGEADYRSSEGKEVYLKPRGKVFNVIREINNGVRSASTYVGCNRIDRMFNHVEFVRVNRQINNVFGN